MKNKRNILFLVAAAIVIFALAMVAESVTSATMNFISEQKGSIRYFTRRRR